jgi:hypothetical protein
MADDTPMVTKTGKVLSDADVAALADEAEMGYEMPEGDPIAKILLSTTDAAVWAHHFQQQFRLVTPDEYTMLTWFANAIETGRSAGQGQVVIAQTNDDGTISLVTELDMERDIRISPQLLVQMIEQHNRSVVANDSEW